VPLIVFADYNAGTPAWYAVPCFAVGVISLSVAFAWLRLRSGSLWPAAILRLTGEFGAALAASLVLTAWLFWTRRGSVVSACTPAGNTVPSLSPAVTASP
jgi:hypothetical protein